MAIGLEQGTATAVRKGTLTAEDARRLDGMARVSGMSTSALIRVVLAQHLDAVHYYDIPERWGASRFVSGIHNAGDGEGAITNRDT